MHERICKGDLVQAKIGRQIPLEFFVPQEMVNGAPGLYLGDNSDSSSLVFFKGEVYCMQKKRLVKCTVIYPRRPL